MNDRAYKVNRLASESQTDGGTSASGMTGSPPTPILSTFPVAAANQLLVLGLVVAGEFIIGLNFSVLAVAMPTIGNVFKLSPAILQWVVSAYALTEAAFLIVGARLSDRYSERAGYVAGCALTVAGQLVCAAATSFVMVIAGRIVQAVGTAVLLPATLALLAHAFPDSHARLRAFAVVLLGQVLASPFGMITSGWLIDAHGWRSVFLISIPIVLGALAAAVRVLPRVPRTGRMRGEVDLPGVLLVMSSSGLIVWSLASFASQGLSQLATSLGPLAAGAAAAGLLVLREYRSANPLFPPTLLRGINFVPALCIQAIFQASGSAALIFVSVALQRGLGLTPIQNGFALVPYAAWSVVVMMIVRRITPVMLRHLRTSLSTAFGIMATGLVLLSLGGDHTDYVTGFLPGLLIIATGMMMGMTTALSEVYRSVPTEQRALASATVYMSRMIFQSMCLALMVSSIQVQFHGTMLQTLVSFAVGYRIAAVVCLIGIAVTIMALRPVIGRPVGGGSH